MEQERKFFSDIITFVEVLDRFKPASGVAAGGGPGTSIS